MSALICVARIGAAHGVRGAVKLWTFTEDPLAVQALRSAAVQGRQAPVRGSSRRARPRIIWSRRSRASRPAMRPSASTASSSTSRAKNCPRPTTDEYYHTDLIGLAAVTTDGEALGRVLAIHNFGAGDIIEIAPLQGHDDAAAVHQRGGAGGRSRRRPRRDRAAAGDRGRGQGRRPPRVVPAKAGTHNHRPWFLAKLVAPAIAKLAAVVMGPGCAARRDDEI